MAERPASLSSPLPRTRGVPPLAALTFIVVVLLVFNLSNWRMMRLLEESKEEDLGRRLRSVSSLITQNLAVPEIPAILRNLNLQGPDEQSATLDAYPDSPEYESLAARLARSKAGSGLAQVLLLTPAGNVVADSNYRFLTGEPLPFAIDSQFLQEAVKGNRATTPLYAWEGEHFQRDYQPLIDDTGTTIGVVMGSISADYLASMQQVRSQVLRLWLLSSIFLVLLGVWLYRTFRYVANLERRALQKVRIEAMGALAGGVAHELRNPLAIIRALAEEVEADQPALNRSTENARDIIAETQRLSDLISHFLSLSRSPEPSEGHRIELNEEVERVVQLMRKSAPETIQFITDLPAERLAVNGDDRAVRQLLLNLMVNARVAFGDKTGLVEITLRERRHMAELRIKDTGPGITKKDLSRVFEPFYTTRATGTGLGLAISRGIAENLGGQLILESLPGKGTPAVVLVPLAGAEPGTR
jgi:signal transduction histidine kinase